MYNVGNWHASVQLGRFVDLNSVPAFISLNGSSYNLEVFLAGVGVSEVFRLLRNAERM